MMKRILSLVLVLACITGLLPPVQGAEQDPLEREKNRLTQQIYSYTIPDAMDWKLVLPTLEDRLTLSGDGRTATLFAPYVNRDGGWYDTNKFWDGKDNALCWAAASSNLLAWYLDSAGREGVDLTGLKRDHMDIFGQFRGVWQPREGYDMNNGLSWYFSGLFTNSPDDPNFNPPVPDGSGRQMMLERHPGGFLRHFPHADQAFLPVSLDPGDAYRDIRNLTGNYPEKFPFCEVLSGVYGTEGELSTHARFSASILRALKYGAVGIVIKPDVSSGGSSHAVTLWGADYDVDTGLIRHIYLTDSDDRQSGLRTIKIQARKPDQDGIYMADYFFGDGSRWTRISDTQMLFAYGVVRDRDYVEPEPEPPAPAVYHVTAQAENLTFHGADTATAGQDYTARLRAEGEYLLPETIAVTVGGEACGDFRYDSGSGALMIPGAAIAGDVVITAAGVQKMYEITLHQTDGGTISADRQTAGQGERVTLTVKAREGYRHTGWQISPAIQVEHNSFLMPGEAVTVSAVFEKIPVVLTGLTIVQAPEKTIYTEGEVFDPAGLVVKAGYSDGSEKRVQPEFSGAGLVPGQTAVELTYSEGGRTVKALQPVTVEEQKPLWPQITGNPDGSRTVADLLEDGTLVKTTAFPGKPAHRVELRLSEQAMEGKNVVVLPISPVNVENSPVIRVETALEREIMVKIPAKNPTEGTTAVEGRKILRKSAVEQDGVVCTVKSGAEVHLEDRAKPFADVQEGDWFRPAVDFVSGRGLFAGVNHTDFGPGLPMTRGMLAQVLHTLHDNPNPRTHRDFPDVTEQNWYAGAVDWAAEQNIISGYPDGRFGGEDPITREQLALMLYSAAGKPAVGPEEPDFADGEQVSGYARTAVRWAVERRIMAGDDQRRLNPQGLASRAEVAAMLRGFVNHFYS